MGLAVGPGPAGLAHRVLGDGREAPRAGVRDPRRRARPRLPAPRERARAVARARPRVRAASGCTTGCSGSPARRCRSRSANIVTLRDALDDVGPRDAARSSSSTAHWRKPLDFSDETMAQAARAGARRFRDAFARLGAPAADGALGRASPPRSRTTSTRPRRWRCCTGGATDDARLLRAGSSVFGLESLAERRRRRPSSSSSPSGARPRARRSDFARPTGCATRSRRPGWDVRDVSRGSSSCRSA